MILLIIVLYSPKRLQLRRLYHFGADYVYKNSDISPKNRAVCDKMAIYLMTCSIRVNLMVFLSYSFLIWAPLYKNFFTDEREMILPVVLPFTDPETDLGFTVNMVNQMISVLLGTFVIPGTEIVTCILKNNVTATAAVIENSLLEFKCMARKEKIFSNKCIWEFRNIIMKILDFDRLEKQKLFIIFYN